MLGIKSDVFSGNHEKGIMKPGNREKEGTMKRRNHEKEES